MAETLGMLCDKLTIVKLKQYHSTEDDRLASLALQCENLKEEIDIYISDAISGKIPIDRLSFDSNKVFKKEGNTIRKIEGSLGDVFYQLAEINCELWHEQEKVYDFESVPVIEKDNVVKKLAILNLERNQCIDAINSRLALMVIEKSKI
jgi:hypothetical protein